MQRSARLVGLVMDDLTQLTLNNKLPVKYIHSDTLLHRGTYCWIGEVPLGELLNTDIIVVLDTFKTMQNHKSKNTVTRLRTGGHTVGNENRYKKVLGIIRRNNLYVVTCRADQRVKDVADMAPVRVTGLDQAYKIASKYARGFSSTQLSLNIA